MVKLNPEAVFADKNPQKTAKAALAAVHSSIFSPTCRISDVVPDV